jgi:hypothetical protein
MDREAADNEMRAYLEDCTRQHGYAPTESDSFGPHELAPGERAWRSCADRGIEEVMIPAARAPKNFRAVIEADRRLTAEVAAGTATRVERRERIEAMLDAAMARELELERAAEHSYQAPPAYTISGATMTFNAQQAQIRTVGRGLR